MTDMVAMMISMRHNQFVFIINGARELRRGVSPVRDLDPLSFAQPTPAPTTMRVLVHQALNKST